MEAIGTIHSPYKTIENMPIQPACAGGTEGRVEVREEFAEGLADLDGFSHVYLLYSFHEVKKTKLKVVPFMDTTERGIFSTRSPARPNRIGLSLVKLLRVEGRTLVVEGIDVLDGTPLLDIKPFIEKFDRVGESRSGWMTASTEEVERKRSDDRFG